MKIAVSSLGLPDSIVRQTLHCSFAALQLSVAILPHCACAPRADTCNFCNRDWHVGSSVQSAGCPAGPPLQPVNTSSRAARTPRTPRRLTFQDTIDGGGSPARHLQGLSDVPLRAGVRKTRCLVHTICNCDRLSALLWSSALDLLRPQVNGRHSKGSKHTKGSATDIT